MMIQMLVLHGEHEIKSRQFLIDQVEVAKKIGKNIVWLDGKKLTTAELESAVGSNSLFGTPQTIIIEQLFSGPKSKRKDELIAWIKTISDRATYPQTDLILWENKTLTTAQLKNFPKAKLELFRLSNAVFSWLDKFSPSLVDKTQLLKYLQQAIKAESADFCFIMLQRQVRMLIQAKDQCLPPTAPFMMTKIRDQASSFSQIQLITLHEKLFEIDRRLKNGLSPANLSQELEVLMLKL